MSEGAITLWLVLTGLSLGFIAIDIRNTPAHPVLKWAFVILTVFTGPLAAFFYVLGCREPIQGTHEAYVSARWRQVLGSTMHCAAGDGLGIVAGAVLGVYWQLAGLAEVALEYALGLGFGWTIFQAFAMRDMAGGSYVRSLKMTFLPEFLSMNLLMAGMVLTMRDLMPRIEGGGDPLSSGFWFVMSMSLIVGFLFAYPINWWLVANGLKHGMITVRPTGDARKSEMATSAAAPLSTPHAGGHDMRHTTHRVSTQAKAAMTILTAMGLALGIVLGEWIRVP